MLLHLLVLCLRPGDPNPNGFYIAGLSISVLLTQSILCQAHQKHYPLLTHYALVLGFLFKSVTHNTQWPFDNAYGGPGGHCPRVLNPFLSTSYSLKTYLINFQRCA